MVRRAPGRAPSTAVGRSAPQLRPPATNIAPAPTALPTALPVAAIALTVLPEALRPVKQYRMVIYALLLIVLMITRPQGLFGTSELRLPWIKRRREVAA